MSDAFGFQIDQLSRAARREIMRQAQVVIQAGVRRAYMQALAAAAEKADILASELQKPIDNARRDMFQRLGENAQRSMVASYGQTVTRRKTVPSYRSGSGRLSGGVLLRAISSPSFFHATADGLEFGDITYLDSEARHWHRINFGAGERGESESDEFPVFGTALRFDDGPSPGFSMPPGVWIENGRRVPAGIRGSSQFYPTTLDEGKGGGGLRAALGRAGARSIRRGRPEAMRPTKGIEAANFMNAGLARIARDLPDLYKALTEDLVAGAIKAVAEKDKSFTIVQGPVLGTGGGTVSKISLP